MDETIRVHVVSYSSCKNLMMRYRDPGTGKQVARSTGTDKRREADKVAAKWESELQEGRYQPKARMEWQAFREYFDAYYLDGKKPATAARYEGALNAFKRLVRPERLSDLSTRKVTAFATELRKTDRTEATVACHLRHLKAAARWANRQGLLPTLPTFDMPKTAAAAKMKGRAVTGEEFDRMLDATPGVVGNEAAEGYLRLLRGFWWSGLRLREALGLRWEEASGAISVDVDGDRAMLRIPAEAEKGGRDRLLPIAPQFEEMLLAVPEANRAGFVFPLVGSRHDDTVGRRISKIGEAAGIVVERRGDKVKYASSHDLRRAFGFRWSRLVMPATLREIMRHATVATTMQFYVGLNAEATSDELRAALGKAQGKATDSAEGAEEPKSLVFK